MLTLLTPTGERPRAFTICQRLMLEQTYRGPVRWVVVDDGKFANSSWTLQSGWKFDLVRPEKDKLWDGKTNTQRSNLSLGLAAIGPDERVVIIEDDDYYGPSYLSAVAEWLELDDLVGECQARYYNIQTRRFHQCGNKNHASLCSTAMRGAALKVFRDIINGQQLHEYIDIALWQGHNGKLYPAQHVVGIKGLPGRRGIGVGHTPDFGKPDSGSAMLREWVGQEYAQVYNGARQ
jgi:hypothetical protein